MKILLVDDDPISLGVLKSALQTAGYETIDVDGGEKAWLILNRESIRLIISDWMMPSLDGLELCRRVRARQKREYVYFILLTARSGAENYHLAMENGVDDFLAKPFRFEELQIRIRVAERILGFMSQVGELKRLLPICSYCKRVRDDKDYWHQIESYIHNHTGTDFSHSICPECYETVIKPQLEEIRRAGKKPE